HEMTSVGYWTPIDEKDGKGKTLIYLLSFPSREAARESWKAFGQDPEWKKVQAESEKDGKIVERVESVFLDPAGYGPTPSPGGSAREPRAFELRTYLASPGKLGDLHKRFQDDTIDIFNTHGMTSVGYFEPIDESKGRGTTLVYMLAFPSRDAARTSWEAFRNDPVWKKAKAASEADGIPLAAKVTSVYLEPTDYSPMK
ncbi:MAG TPA: NIPSNAP family protein, partial [Isosphaeraceae bacterium]|nr:NIPSNAP family protein [Isosphaeraceae bacterium]